ncbi:amino acid transporter [Aureobasidium subglaciale]|nr:amino acid transporter [Aureobasidium subglaciale]
MNAIIFLSVVSTGSISCYAGARTLMGLAHLGMAPKQFAKADKSGRGGLAYLNVNNYGAQVFTWFSNLTSLFTLFCWGSICLSHIRFRLAWKAQGRLIDDLPWKSRTYPYAAWWALARCIILLVVEFYLSVWPLGEPPSARTFFANYAFVVAIVFLYLGARVYYRGPWWVNISKVDFDLGRKFYADSQDLEKKHDDMVRKVVKGIFT